MAIVETLKAAGSVLGRVGYHCTIGAVLAPRVSREFLQTVATTVREFTAWCFERVGLDWQDHLRFDEGYLRPTEVAALVGDASKAHRDLGWKAETMPEQLAGLMVDAESQALGDGRGARP